jgi:uncharacterized protein YqeY
VRTTLRRDLTAALKARDLDATNALRSALAAIDNAEAPDADDRLHGVTGDQHTAGSTAGVGTTEIARCHLDESKLRAIIETGIDERMDAAAGYEHSGHTERAESLRSEADVLRRYLRPAP